MGHRTLHPGIGVIVLLALLSGSCAKRPVTAIASAPAPTGISAPSVPQPPTAPEAAPLPPAAPTPSAPAAPARPGPSGFVEVAALRDIFFAFDKWAIGRDAATALQANIDWLKTHPSALVLIEGHCDERGTNAYNLALGERRAQAARDYLVARGVPADRITVISYGEERPVCLARTEACWQRNRRAHFLAKIR